MIILKFICRFRLHRNWPRTHFILNLAFADLLMCGIGFPFQIFVYFHRSWEWGIRSCQIIANILHIIYYSEWFSVAMVAATCCITVTKPRGLYSFFMRRRNRIIVILSIWSLGFTLLLPTNLQVYVVIHSGIILRSLNLPLFVKFEFILTLSAH